MTIDQEDPSTVAALWRWLEDIRFPITQAASGEIQAGLHHTVAVPGSSVSAGGTARFAIRDRTHLSAVYKLAALTTSNSTDSVNYSIDQVIVTLRGSLPADLCESGMVGIINRQVRPLLLLLEQAQPGLATQALVALDVGRRLEITQYLRRHGIRQASVVPPSMNAGIETTFRDALEMHEDSARHVRLIQHAVERWNNCSVCPIVSGNWLSVPTALSVLRRADQLLRGAANRLHGGIVVHARGGVSRLLQHGPQHSNPLAAAYSMAHAHLIEHAAPGPRLLPLVAASGMLLSTPDSVLRDNAAAPMRYSADEGGPVVCNTWAAVAWYRFDRIFTQLAPQTDDMSRLITRTNREHAALTREDGHPTDLGRRLYLATPEAPLAGIHPCHAQYRLELGEHTKVEAFAKQVAVEASLVVRVLFGMRYLETRHSEEAQNPQDRDLLLRARLPERLITEIARWQQNA